MKSWTSAWWKRPFLILAAAAERKLSPPAVRRYYPQRPRDSGLSWSRGRTERRTASTLTGPGMVSTTMPESSWDLGPGVIWSPLCCSLICGKKSILIRKKNIKMCWWILFFFLSSYQKNKNNPIRFCCSLLTQRGRTPQNFTKKKVSCEGKQCCSPNQQPALLFNDHIFHDSSDGTPTNAALAL